MYLDHRVILKISHIFDQMTMRAMLMDANGHVILPESEHRDLVLPDALIQNPSEPLVYGGFTLIGTEGAQPLFLCLEGDSQDVISCTRLCAELINTITRIDMSQVNMEQSMRMILRAELEGVEMEAVAAEVNLPQEHDRVVVYVHFSDINMEMAMDLMEKVVSEEDGDVLVEVGRHSIALVKMLNEQFEFSEMEALAATINQTFLAATEREVEIGIGDPRSTLGQLSDSFKEARSAITIGHIYHPQGGIFVYRKMLLERFLSDVPEEMSAEYNQLMFNRRNARLFNEEMIHTIEKFFENSLNLSETARQLYIHRNTLVYRLDKVQRNIGLDLRAFDDAVTFKLMMLLGKNSSDRKGRKS